MKMAPRSGKGMNAVRWKRTEEVYQCALASPPNGRGALERDTVNSPSTRWQG
jgi:hypothetical protein